MLRPKAVPEKILKKLVEAEPLALGVEWDKEHRLMFELFEEELGLLQAGELPHQVGAERIDDRNAKQDSAERVWECFEHFAAQIVRHQAVIPLNSAINAPSSWRPRSVMAASCSPATQPSVRCTSTATFSSSTGR